MRILAIAILVSLRLAALCGQATDGLIAVGRCATNALRIRDYPGSNADSSRIIGSFASGDELVVLGRLSDAVTIDGLRSSWYAVVGMEGKIGWSFGGYIDVDAAKLRVFPGSDEGFEVVESEAYDALASEGGACRLLRFSGGIPETEAVFAKTAKGRPQVIYLSYTDDISYSSVDGIRAVDYFGDESKELCIEWRGGAGDQGGRSILIFGRSAQEDRYTDYGVIGLDDYAGGGGWDIGSGSSLVEGPSPFYVGKTRCIRLVKEASYAAPIEDRGDGIRRREVGRRIFEELFELSDSKISLLKETTYSVEKSEEEEPKP